MGLNGNHSLYYQVRPYVESRRTSRQGSSRPTSGEANGRMKYSLQSCSVAGARGYQVGLRASLALRKFGYYEGVYQGGLRSVGGGFRSNDGSRAKRCYKDVYSTFLANGGGIYTNDSFQVRGDYVLFGGRNVAGKCRRGCAGSAATGYSRDSLGST